MNGTKTYLAKPADVNRQWHTVDATDQTLGRLATRLARVLMGKHKPTYTPHVDDGDYVIVVNAEKIVFKGDKFAQKTYYHHTGYVGACIPSPMDKTLHQCTRTLGHMRNVDNQDHGHPEGDGDAYGRSPARSGTRDSAVKGAHRALDDQ